ncbi:peptidase S24/S26A/S26B/S26C [Phellopilus nigrolimitatus]|nr:peptidase S24/S26A/S26B/S26C [Phellopilus nigrolimitatus]
MAFRLSRRTWRTLAWAPVAVMFAQHGYTVKFITGRSMQPTLNPEPCVWRDLVLFDRLSVHAGRNTLRRGDVVSLESPVKPGQFIVKRVVGLPGDVVQTLPPYPEPEITVPAGHVWIEGSRARFRIFVRARAPR